MSTLYSSRADAAVEGTLSLVRKLKAENRKLQERVMSQTSSLSYVRKQLADERAKSVQLQRRVEILEQVLTTERTVETRLAA